MFQTLQYIALTLFLQENTKKEGKSGISPILVQIVQITPKVEIGPQSVKMTPKMTKFAYFWRVPKGVYVIFVVFGVTRKLTKNSPNSAV